MIDKAVADLILASPVFSGIPTREIEALVRVTRTAGYRSREYIFMEGDSPLWLYVIKSGRVKILKHSRAGKDVVLELLQAGEIFGGVAVLEKRPYPAAAQAMEPTEVLKIPCDSVLVLSERHPSIVKEMALMIGRRLRTAHESIRSLAVEPVELRLAATLVRLADREGKRSGAGVELPYHLTRQTLANMAGTTVETTIRVVGRWIKEGLVAEDGWHLVLKKPEVLREMAIGESETS